jgi:hypothetical protein
MDPQSIQVAIAHGDRIDGQGERTAWPRAERELYGSKHEMVNRG